MSKRIISLKSALFWTLVGVGLGFLLLVGGWSSLQAESEEVRREIRLAQAELDKLEPQYREVMNLKARRVSLESLLVDIGSRSKLFEVSEAVVSAAESGVVLERLDVEGLDVRVVVQAESSPAVESFIESLRKNEIFTDVDLSEAESTAPPRFEVRCKWRPAVTGGKK